LTDGDAAAAPAIMGDVVFGGADGIVEPPE
jgi:hypothetical protein